MSNVIIPAASSLASNGQTIQRPASLLRQALRLRRTQIGLAIMVLLMLVAMLGRYFAPFGETAVVGDGLPNVRNAAGTLFGSDYFGRPS